MPRIDGATKAFEVRKIIDASIPRNASKEQLAALDSEWKEKARIRNAAVARQVAIPETPTKFLHYELRKFGRHWNAYIGYGKKAEPVLPAPSLLSSALDALYDCMCDEAMKA